MATLRKCLPFSRTFSFSLLRYYTNMGFLFNHPLLASAEGFDVLTQTTIQESQRLVRDITNTSNREAILSLFDQLSDTLCRGADLAECIRLLHPDPKYANKAAECCSVLGSYVEQLNTNLSLYNSLKHVNCDGLDEASVRHAEILLRDFEVSGIHLPIRKRSEFVKLHQQILSLSHTFINHCNDPTYVEAPPRILSDNKHLFTTSKSKGIYINSIPFYSPNRNLREYCYKSYYSPSHSNNIVLHNLLTARNKLAQLVGYDSFARRTLVGSMAGTPEIVREFLDALNDHIQPLAREEVKQMLSNSNVDKLNPWDYPLLFEQTREKFYNKSEELHRYFSLPSCIKGLQGLLQSLFNVQLKLSNPSVREVWHSSVSKFSFMREGEHLGNLYCDWFNREGKITSDCQFTIQGGRSQNDGTYQLPISTLSLSLPYGDPPLMTPQSVQNVFHEMGHALHSILGRSPYQNTSGTRCSTDFAEVPSNLMELFLKDSRILKSFAKHHKTGAELSPLGMMKFKHFTDLYPAFITQEQILHSVMDQCFHGNRTFEVQSTREMFAKLHEEYSVIDYVPDTAWYLRFTHLYTYAGKYYSYLWARSVANLIWYKCFHDDPFSFAKGQLYEKAVLAAGGGANPWTLVENVLGYRPSIKDLVDAYYHEIVSTKEQINSMHTQ